jgi:hypothetical protein
VHDNPGKGNNITRFVQVSEFTNQQACCGDIRKQKMTTAGNRGDAIGSWPNEFDPTMVIYPLDLRKSQVIYKET